MGEPRTAQEGSMLAWTLSKDDWTKLRRAGATVPADLRALLRHGKYTAELATEFGMEWPVDKARKLLPHAERLKLRSARELKQAIAAHDHNIMKSKKRPAHRKKPR